MYAHTHIIHVISTIIYINIYIYINVYLSISYISGSVTATPYGRQFFFFEEARVKTFHSKMHRSEIKTTFITKRTQSVAVIEANFYLL